jgi:hypothetical protein
MGRRVPSEIHTGCAELDRAWREYAQHILGRPGVLIPDTDDDLTWHAFLGHSIDMQGFRAAEFAGVDALSRPAARFRSLKERGLGVPELGRLWHIRQIQDHLRKRRGVSLGSTLDALRRHGGSDGESLADAFQSFPWRKGNWSVRALLQNSAALEIHGYSFRRWLEHGCAELGAGDFPPRDFRTRRARNGVPIEEALRRRVEDAFYMVGPQMSAYMLCDWQLWLWNEGKTEVFAMYKQDSFHEEFVSRYGRRVIPADRVGFTAWWFSEHPDLPPRLANECIWLGMEHGIFSSPQTAG